MIELGKKQTLTVMKTVEFGIYLAENKEADAKNRVLLPAKQVPQGTKEGDRLEVFIYKDSQDASYFYHKRASDHSGTDCSSEGSSGDKNRSIS